MIFNNYNKAIGVYFSQISNAKQQCAADGCMYNDKRTFSFYLYQTSIRILFKVMNPCDRSYIYFFNYLLFIPTLVIQIPNDIIPFQMTILFIQIKIDFIKIGCIYLA